MLTRYLHTDGVVASLEGFPTHGHPPARNRQRWARIRGDTGPPVSHIARCCRRAPRHRAPSTGTWPRGGRPRAGCHTDETAVRTTQTSVLWPRVGCSGRRTTRGIAGAPDGSASPSGARSGRRGMLLPVRDFVEPVHPPVRPPGPRAGGCPATAIIQSTLGGCRHSHGEFGPGHIEGALSAPLRTTAKAVEEWTRDTKLVC